MYSKYVLRPKVTECYDIAGLFKDEPLEVEENCDDTTRKSPRSYFKWLFHGVRHVLVSICLTRTICGKIYRRYRDTICEKISISSISNDMCSLKKIMSLAVPMSNFYIWCQSKHVRCIEIDIDIECFSNIDIDIETRCLTLDVSMLIKTRFKHLISQFWHWYEDFLQVLASTVCIARLMYWRGGSLYSLVLDL